MLSSYGFMDIQVHVKTHVAMKLKPTVVCVSVCLVECSAVWSLLLSQLYTNTHHKVVSRSTESASQLSCLSTVNCSR